MNIAVDARELAGRATGVGRYLAALLERWQAMPEARRHEWRLYTHAPIAVPDAFTRSVVSLAGTGGTQWEQWTLARALARQRPDVLFAPGYTAPFTTPCPIALTVHDVSFFAHPEWFAAREGLRRRTVTAWSARRARLVLTDSQFSAGEIVRHIGVPADKVRVIALGMDPPQAVRSAASAPRREPLVLYVGSIFARRHITTLIDTFAGWVAPRVPESQLVIVGENRLTPPADPAAVLHAYPPEIAGRVSLRSYVDEETLHDLYQRARVFAFLSSYEGFGLTPLEALAHGVPPVVLDTPVAREVYGAAARYVSDLSRHEPLGRALVEMLTSDDERRGLLARADAVLAQYDWTRTATATLRAIEEAAGV